jgi:hypothetical protein
LKKNCEVWFWAGLGLLAFVSLIILIVIFSAPIVLVWLAVGPEMVQFAIQEPGIFGVFIAMALVVAWLVNRTINNTRSK